MFVAGFVKHLLLENVDHVPHVEVQTANMTLLLGNIPPRLQSFSVAAYNEKLNRRRPLQMTLKPLNSSQVYFISQFLLLNEILNHQKPLLQRMTAL